MHAHTRRAKTILFAAFAFACAGRVHAASSVTVTDTGDGTSNSTCTLRGAIAAANMQSTSGGCVFSGSGSPTTIAFAIPGSGVQTIDVGSQLPAIAVPVILDGLTQPGASCAAWPPTLLIQISSPTNGQYNGLTLNPGSDGSTIRGLVINGFNNNQGYAYNFNAAINIYASNGNHVECNFLGTLPDGTTAAANLRGVDINSASNNVIGSDGTAKPYFARNLISGNQYGQVDTRGNALSGNRISGNFIGTDVTGTAAMSGQGGAEGVDISANPGPASGNFVGWDGVGDPALDAQHHLGLHRLHAGRRQHGGRRAGQRRRRQLHRHRRHRHAGNSEFLRRRARQQFERVQQHHRQHRRAGRRLGAQRDLRQQLHRRGHQCGEWHA